MRNIIILCFVLLLNGYISSAQDLTCADFKTGKFYIPINDKMKVYTVITNDSISKVNAERDLTISKYIVLRKDGSQIEWKNGIGNGSPTHEIIEWIDDCSYRLTYDSSKGEVNDDLKWINENNGIVISKSKIEGNCMFYTATMTANDGRKISQDGIICKE